MKIRLPDESGALTCDSSVMPNEISANTNAPTIMIAENAADIVAGRAPERASVEAAW